MPPDLQRLIVLLVFLVRETQTPIMTNFCVGHWSSAPSIATTHLTCSLFDRLTVRNIVKKTQYGKR